LPTLSAATVEEQTDNESSPIDGSPLFRPSKSFTSNVDLIKESKDKDKPSSAETEQPSLTESVPCSFVKPNIDYCLSLRFCLDKLEQYLSIDEGDQKKYWLCLHVLLKHEVSDFESYLPNNISQNDKKEIREMIQNTKRCWKEVECKTKLEEIEASIAKPIIEGWKVLYKQIVKLLISATDISELPDDRINADNVT